jgi:hypothetical protein
MLCAISDFLTKNYPKLTVAQKRRKFAQSGHPELDTKESSVTRFAQCFENYSSSANFSATFFQRCHSSVLIFDKTMGDFWATFGRLFGRLFRKTHPFTLPEGN